MCGIFCALSLASAHSQWNQRVYEHLKRRGPNSSRDLTITDSDLSYRCLFSAHVLHMRGLLTAQPLQDNAGNILLWNGEIFSGLPVTPEENDTAVVAQRLSSCNAPSEILAVLSAIRGPWGFVYYQKAGDYLWFGRDFFGRRSLLWTFDAEAGELTLTSVAAHTSGPKQCVWQEVPVAGVFRVNLKAAAEAGCVAFEVYPWAHAESDVSNDTIPQVLESVPRGCSAVMNQSGLELSSPVLPMNVSLPETLNDTEIHSNSCLSVEDLEKLLGSEEKIDEVNHLIDVLSEAVRRRVQSLPFRALNLSPPAVDCARVAILFSGGIDSMILAALADRHIPAHEPVDLLNVAFKLQEPKKQNKSSRKPKNKPIDLKADRENSQVFSPFDVPDRITGRAGVRELQELNPERKWNFVEINVTQEELQEKRLECVCHLVHPLDTVLDDSIGCAVWFAARGVGFIAEGDHQRPFTSSAKVRKSGVSFVGRAQYNFFLI